MYWLVLKKMKVCLTHSTMNQVFVCTEHGPQEISIESLRPMLNANLMRPKSGLDVASRCKHS